MDEQIENIENTENTENTEPEKVKTEEEIKAEKKKHFKSELIDWVKSLFFYCILPLVVFECFFFIANVPTGSMETTVPAGSSVITSRCYDKGSLKRGDVAVFWSEELNMMLFKRCIGLPGDNIEFDGSGSLYINGELYEEPYVSSYSTFEGSFNVPEDCYFFCGDNREWSLDARFWENPYVSENQVKGIARVVIFPFSSFGIIE